MISHVIRSLNLALRNVKFKDGRFQKGEVVNGGWTLVRSKNEWQAKSGQHIVNRWPVKPEDEQVLDVPKEYGDHYNNALNWASSSTQL